MTTKSQQAKSSKEEKTIPPHVVSSVEQARAAIEKVGRIDTEKGKQSRKALQTTKTRARKAAHEVLCSLCFKNSAHHMKFYF
jgi:hypothetical protein